MIKEFLSRDLNSYKLHNAYLINTDDVKLALEEIVEFLGDNFYEKQLYHPDFTIVKKDDKLKNISVEQIRNLQNFLNKTSVISGIKSAVIVDADDMNLNAYNSCLKMLEDTPTSSYIFLITSSVAMILPTIRSRCATIRHNFHSDKMLLDTVDDRYIKPFLKNNILEEYILSLKEFSTGNRKLWGDYSTNVQYLLLRVIKKLYDFDITLSSLELEFLSQISSDPIHKIIRKYNDVVELTEDTITFDLDIRASYLLLKKIIND